MAKAVTNELMPALLVVQLAPAFVLLLTPETLPTYIVVGVCGSMATALVGSEGSPLLMSVQLAPPSVLLKTYLGVNATAYMVVGVLGSMVNPKNPLKSPC